MNDKLNRKRDEYSKNLILEEQKIYALGWDHAIEELASMGSEFDEHAFAECDSLLDIAEWQHERTSALYNAKLAKLEGEIERISAADKVKADALWNLGEQVVDLKEENQRLRDALEKIKSHAGTCFYGTPTLSKDPEVAYRQGSYDAFNETASTSKEALKTNDAGGE